MSRRTLLLVLLIAAVVNPHPSDASASSDAAERPRLAGRWRLDPEKSENAEATLREAMERGRPSGGMAAGRVASGEGASAGRVPVGRAGAAVATGADPVGQRG